MGASRLVLDFQNSEACFMSAKQATRFFFLRSDFGRDRVMLDFENSVLHLPSAEKDLRKLVKLNNEGWFRSNVVNGFLRDDRYECLFRRSRSVKTQGESSCMNFIRKSGFTKYGSSLQEDVGDKNVGYTDFPHEGCSLILQCKRREVSLRCGKSGMEDCMAPSHGKTTRNTRSRAVRVEGRANPASTKPTKNQERKTPETSTEAINKPLKRTLFLDESMEQKKHKKTNGKVVHFTSTVA
ncbi:hypothetical protein Tco_1164976 [Tanacetum coccineum]